MRKNLIQAIHHEIEQSSNKAIPYSKYIELALYHPTEGYYQNNETKIGKEGDFYTSSFVHEIFAQQLGEFFSKVCSYTGMPKIICEIGGGDGRFAQQLSSSLLESEWEYIIIESSPYHRAKIKERTFSFKKLQVFGSLEKAVQTVNGLEGIIFSNEWLDAFPVDVIEKKNNKDYEIMVSMDQKGYLCEKYVPLSTERKDWLEKNQLSLEEGFRIEVPSFLLGELKKVDHLLSKGLIVTVDYGYTAEERKHPSRKKGSLRGYQKHQMKNNVLLDPGEMDITHHVHWDVVERMGQGFGWTFVDRMKQREFLVHTGILDQLVEHHSTDPFSAESKKNRAIRSLILGDGIGNSFDVCLQSKSLSPKAIHSLYVND
ncbi:SAM-dependent methyltransferase [Bacillaceae bacterium S4-13-56]